MGKSTISMAIFKSYDFCNLSNPRDAEVRVPGCYVSRKFLQLSIFLMFVGHIQPNMSIYIYTYVLNVYIYIYIYI